MAGFEPETSYIESGTTCPHPLLMPLQSCCIFFHWFENNSEKWYKKKVFDGLKESVFALFWHKFNFWKLCELWDTEWA